MLAGMWTLAKPKMPGPGEALPGRAEKMPVPDEALRQRRARCKPPFPAGTELATFGLGCFWGAEKKFWQLPGVYSTAVGYAGGRTPNPTYREVCSGLTGHTEVVQVVFDPKVVSYDELLQDVLGDRTIRRRGCARGTTSARSTGRRSTRTATRSARRRARRATRTARALTEAGYGAITTEIAAGAGVLLRRGLPPAVPGEEPRRLLRPRAAPASRARSASASASRHRAKRSRSRSGRRRRRSRPGRRSRGPAPGA